MAAQYVSSKADVAPTVSALLHNGDRIAVGGSVTLEETQVLELVRGGKYQFIDRYEPGLTTSLQKERLIQAFSADVFICSANAITMAGLMRRHQDLLDAGKVTAAADLMDYITKLEEQIADMEANG